MAINERIEAMRTKKAAGLTAAKYNKRHHKPYPKAESLSTLEMLIGALLLFGNKDQKVFWPFFEAMLLQDISLKLASEKTSHKPGATNSGQTVVG